MIVTNDNDQPSHDQSRRKIIDRRILATWIDNKEIKREQDSDKLSTITTTFFSLFVCLVVIS